MASRYDQRLSQSGARSYVHLCATDYAHKVSTLSFTQRSGDGSCPFQHGDTAHTQAGLFFSRQHQIPLSPLNLVICPTSHPGGSPHTGATHSMPIITILPIAHGMRSWPRSSSGILETSWESPKTAKRPATYKLQFNYMTSLDLSDAPASSSQPSRSAVRCSSLCWWLQRSAFHQVSKPHCMTLYACRCRSC